MIESKPSDGNAMRSAKIGLHLKKLDAEMASPNIKEEKHAELNALYPNGACLLPHRVQSTDDWTAYLAREGRPSVFLLDIAARAEQKENEMFSATPRYVTCCELELIRQV